jgi:lysophospholipase L1-like esterase
LPAQLQALGLKARLIDERPAFGTPYKLTQLLTDQADYLQEHQPDWVLVDAGQAEAWVAGAAESGQSLLSPDEFQLLYGQLLQRIQASGSRAILLTPCPSGPSLPRWRNDRIQEYVQQIGLAANQYSFPVVDVWSTFMAYPEREGSSLNELLQQGRFPNAAGHERIAQQIAATLEYTLMYEQ